MPLRLDQSDLERTDPGQVIDLDPASGRDWRMWYGADANGNLFECLDRDRLQTYLKGRNDLIFEAAAELNRAPRR